TVYVRSHCGDGSFSSWSNGFEFITAITNDDCNGAIALTVNPDFSCTAFIPGTVAGATMSNVTSTCSGTADDDVWFSFTATDTMHRIMLFNSAGFSTQINRALWSGDCGNPTLVPGSCNGLDIAGLTIGTTYYLQLYTFTSTPAQTATFNVCIGTDFENAVGEIAAPSNFSVYPNPASTELFIGTVDGKPVHVMVYDMVGHLVMDQDVVVKLNVTDLAPGSYSLVILDEKGTTRSHARFIKQ
ncbi:MAG: T9SS type A sorting domain-containing protein, partial [Flavobacteriales bacterium]